MCIGKKASGIPARCEGLCIEALLHCSFVNKFESNATKTSRKPYRALRGDHRTISTMDKGTKGAAKGVKGSEQRGNTIIRQAKNDGLMLRHGMSSNEKETTKSQRRELWGLYKTLKL